MWSEEAAEILHWGELKMPYPRLKERGSREKQINTSALHGAEAWHARIKGLLETEVNRQGGTGAEGFGTQFHCQIMRLDEEYLSYFCDCYLTLGRIAPKLLRSSWTYDLKTAGRLLLPDFFCSGEPWQQLLCRRIRQQRYADRQPAYTFFASPRLRLSPHGFYLSELGMVLWLPAGEFAPLNTGIPSFLLTADMLQPILRRSV